MTIQELLDYLFDNTPPVLSPHLARWLNESPRFTAFVETHRDKIRKKIRSIQSSESFQDLLAELEAAYLLLQEKRFTLAYESYGKGTGRGPDFAVTFKTHTTFNVEVTRMRGSSPEHDKGQRQGEPSPFDQQYESNRLVDTICSKLGQTLPSMMNLLVIMADHPAMCEVDVDKAMIRLKQRAEQKEPHLFKRHGFQDTSDFFKHYQRLSGVLLRSRGDDETGKCPILWINNQAKHSLPGPICTILQR